MKILLQLPKAAPAELEAFEDPTPSSLNAKWPPDPWDWRPIPTVMCLTYQNRKRRIYRAKQGTSYPEFFVKIAGRPIQITFKD